MAVRDPYIALGVARGAAVAEIKTAYRRRARVLHPDVNTSDPDAAEKFKELVAAYELLCDPDRRAVYDNSRIGFGESWDARGGRPTPARQRRPPPQVWSSAQVVQMRERPGRRRHAAPLQRMAINPDLRRVASQRGETVHLWDAATGRSVAHTGRDERGVGWLGFSPDGRVLVTDGVRGTALWDAMSGRLVDRLNLDGRGHLSFSSDGRLLATATHTLVEVSDSRRGRQLRQIAHEATVESIGFSADGRRLATAAGVTAHVWEVSSGLEIARLMHDKPPAAMSLSADGRYLATCTTAARSRWTPSEVRLWEVESGDELAQVEHSCWIDQIVFSPDSRRLVTDSNGTMHLWDVGDWRELARMKFVTSEIVFGPDGRWLTAAFGPDLYVWDAETGHQVACLAHGSEILSVAVDPDGRRIGTAGVHRPREQSGFAPAMAHVWLRAERLGA